MSVSSLKQSSSHCQVAPSPSHSLEEVIPCIDLGIFSGDFNACPSCFIRSFELREGQLHPRGPSPPVPCMLLAAHNFIVTPAASQGSYIGHSGGAPGGGAAAGGRYQRVSRILIIPKGFVVCHCDAHEDRVV